MVPIEAKAAATLRPAMADSIRAFQADYGERASPGYVIYAGDRRLPVAPGVTGLPFGAL